MGRLKIDPDQVKFFGAGVRMDWAGVIGAVIDLIIHDKPDAPVSDAELLAGIRTKLSTPGGLDGLKDPSTLTHHNAAVVKGMLHHAGSTLSVNDLSDLFSQAGGAH